MNIVKMNAYLTHNVGDDLMVEILLNRYPDVKFFGAIPYQEKTVEMEKSNYFDETDISRKFGRLNHLVNLITLYRKKNIFMKFIYEILEKNFCCGIIIGGSIYRQSLDEDIQCRMEAEYKKRVHKKPFYVIGANFGPYKDQEFYDAFVEYFKGCENVSFRDRKSYELFSSIQQVQWAPDIVFNIPVGEIDDKMYTLISVIKVDDRPGLCEYKEDYINKIIEICEEAIKRSTKPVLVSFCGSEGDEEAISEILSRMSEQAKRQTESYLYQGDTSAILQLFRNAHMIIATRFHSMILAMRFHKPLYTISYDLKTNNVLDDTLSTAWCEFKELRKITVDEIFEKASTPVEVADYIADAQRQFYALDKLLKKN